MSNLLERGPDGLIKSIEHKRNEFGKVDWKSLIPLKYLTPNKNKTSETDVSKLKDEELIVRIGGYRYLADLRGYKSVMCNAKTANPDYACVQVVIEFLPNFETDNQPRIYSANAEAHFANTKDFGRLYYVRVAENRAFACAVRNFLNIEIVSEEEIAEMPEAKPVDEDIQKMEDLLKERELDFSFIKEILIEEKFIGAENFNSLTDIPKFELRKLYKKLSKAKRVTKKS